MSGLYGISDLLNTTAPTDSKADTPQGAVFPALSTGPGVFDGAGSPDTKTACSAFTPFPSQSSGLLQHRRSSAPSGARVQLPPPQQLLAQAEADREFLPTGSPSSSFTRPQTTPLLPSISHILRHTPSDFRQSAPFQSDSNPDAVSPWPPRTAAIPPLHAPQELASSHLPDPARPKTPPPKHHQKSSSSQLTPTIVWDADYFKQTSKKRSTTSRAPPSNQGSIRSFVCSNVRCGSFSTPLWRKGWTNRDGTVAMLCNACGLHYKKGHFCAFCNQIFRESEIDHHANPFVSCTKCNRWVHLYCAQSRQPQPQPTPTTTATNLLCPECLAQHSPQPLSPAETTDVSPAHSLSSIFEEQQQQQQQKQVSATIQNLDNLHLHPPPTAAAAAAPNKLHESRPISQPFSDQQLG